MLTIKQFINRLGIGFAAAQVKDNPHMLDIMDGARHWRCTIRKDRRRMTVYFSRGSAISGEPSVGDVLDCLASDASGYENARGFEDWCAEYGYDTDSRKAVKIYRTVERQASALRRMLGSTAAYETLLWQTERE